MKIEVRFPAAPRTQMRKNIIELCEKVGGSVNDNIMSVSFSSGLDQNIAKIISHISNWSGSEIYVEGNRIELKDCKYVLDCHLKSTCDGVCSQFTGEMYCDCAGKMILKIIDHDPWQEGFPDRYFGLDEENQDRFRLYSFLEEATPNHFSLDKVKMYNEILKIHELQSLFCDKFSKEIILKKNTGTTW